MVTQTVKWKPSVAPNVIQYELWYSDTGITGTYALLATVNHTIPGPNYIDVPGGTSYFFYEDSYVPYRFYRLRLRDQYGNVAEDSAPAPFQAGNDPVVAPVMHVVALNDNTGTPNRLQYITEGGTPIEGATIRVYKKSDYDMRNLTLVVGLTTTDASGRWKDSVYVEPGLTYTIIFSKPNAYGPDKVEIVI